VSDLFGSPNPQAFDAMPLTWGDTALANEFGTSASAMGHDSASATKSAMTTAPETAKNPFSLNWSLDDYLQMFKSGTLPLFGPLLPSMKAPALGSSKSASGNAVASFYTNHRNLVLSLVLVVLALVMFSRGFAKLGAEGIQVIEKMGNKGGE
jgi:hypothetical protein